MVDMFSHSTRSQIMSKVRSKNTKPELKVRKFLYNEGFRYRLYTKDVLGHPDLLLKKYKALIFVNGCFWHGHSMCKHSKLPSSNKVYWEKKILRNISRDKNNIKQLLEKEWRVLIVWECSISTLKKMTVNLPKIKSWLLSNKQYLEIPEN